VWVTREVVQMMAKKEDIVVRCFLSLDAAARHFKVVVELFLFGLPRI
jgi:hypothetical protein